VPRKTRQALVLLIEDQEDTREGYATYLQAAGMTVLTAADGAEALRVFHRDRPDVVVLDLGLPDMNGLDVLTQIKAAPHADRIPVIVVTGRDLGCKPEGAAVVLRKPVLPFALLSNVQRWAARHKKRA
jgi:CheY-like chemotaxis protein